MAHVKDKRDVYDSTKGPKDLEEKGENVNEEYEEEEVNSSNGKEESGEEEEEVSNSNGEEESGEEEEKEEEEKEEKEEEINSIEGDGEDEEEETNSIKDDGEEEEIKVDAHDPAPTASSHDDDDDIQPLQLREDVLSSKRIHQGL